MPAEAKRCVRWSLNFLFYTGHNQLLTDKLFRESGLCDEKWDRPQASQRYPDCRTWGQYVIADTAIGCRHEARSPSSNSALHERPAGLWEPHHSGQLRYCWYNRISNLLLWPECSALPGACQEVTQACPFSTGHLDSKRPPRSTESGPPQCRS